MRLKLLSSGLVVLAALVGCKPPPAATTTKNFQKELHLLFNNFNNEAQARKDDLRKRDVQLGLVPATGTIYSTYFFDENAFIVKNYKCKVCETRLLLVSPSQEYLCPSCGHCPYVAHPKVFNRKESPCKLCVGPDGKPHEPAAAVIAKEVIEKDAQVLPMFEPTKENPGSPFEAKVRYIRRQWALDSRGIVEVSPKVSERGTIDMSFVPTGAEGSQAKVGYHRLDATFVGEVWYKYQGGELIEVKRLLEEPVRPWKDLKGNQ